MAVRRVFDDHAPLFGPMFDDAIIGAGAVVTRPVGAGEKMVGVPARAVEAVSERHGC